jgi:hypothetical protein
MKMYWNGWSTEDVSTKTIVLVGLNVYQDIVHYNKAISLVISGAFSAGRDTSTTTSLSTPSSLASFSLPHLSLTPLPPPEDRSLLRRHLHSHHHQKQHLQVLEGQWHQLRIPEIHLFLEALLLNRNLLS